MERKTEAAADEGKWKRFRGRGAGPAGKRDGIIVVIAGKTGIMEAGRYIGKSGYEDERILAE